MMNGKTNRKLSEVAVIGLFIVAVLCVGGPVEGAPTLDYIPDNLAEIGAPTGYVRVVKPRMYVSIDNARVTFETGSILPLYQENEDYFIALADTEHEGERLCAFPVMVGGSRLAWVSAEHNMVFARRGSSCSGRMYLQEGEELPVIGETARHYEAVVERMRRLAAVRIPKNNPRVQYLPGLPMVNPLSRIQEADLPPIRTEIVMVGTNRAVTQKESESSEKLFSKLAKMFGGDSETGKTERIRTDEVLRPLSPIQVESPAPPISTVEWSAVEAPLPVVTPPPPLPNRAAGATSAPAIKAPPAEKRARSLITGKAYPFLIFLLALVLLAVAVIPKWIRSRRQLVPTPDGEEKVKTGGQTLHKPAAGTISSAADFSGSLTGMSMSVLAQMLNSEQATGVLSLKDKEHDELGSLTFVNGEIVDAQAVGTKGKEAVLILIRQKKGSFLFIRKARLETRKTVYQSTVSLLLEAAKQSDETP